jgi:hypothetical protein
MSPPERESRPAGNGTASNSTSPSGSHSTVYTRQLRARRAASWRLPALDHTGLSDPWHYDASGIGNYAAAAAHLLEQGLTPAPDLEALRVMRRRGGHHRRNAETITERWGLAS